MGHRVYLGCCAYTWVDRPSEMCVRETLLLTPTDDINIAEHFGT